MMACEESSRFKFLPKRGARHFNDALTFQPYEKAAGERYYSRFPPRSPEYIELISTQTTY